MTENKRYVRILDHSEKEVRIFDENNQKNIFNIFFEGLDSAICLKGALEDTVDLLNELNEENEQLKSENKELKEENKQLKAQLSVDIDEGICYICKHQKLIPHKDMQGYYTAICEKGYLQCSKSSIRYCEDFEMKEL